MEKYHLISLALDGLDVIGLTMICTDTGEGLTGTIGKIDGLNLTEKSLNSISQNATVIYTDDKGIKDLLDFDWKNDHCEAVFYPLETSLNSLVRLYRAISEVTVKVESLALARRLTSAITENQNSGNTDPYFRAVCSLSHGYFSQNFLPLELPDLFRSGKRATDVTRFFP